MGYLSFKRRYNIYPEVVIRPRFNLDDEVESIDVLIDGMSDELHCAEFAFNDECEPVRDHVRTAAHRAIALKELTPGLYNEHGNPIRNTK